MYLNITMKEKKTVLLLIPDCISIEEHLSKTMTVSVQIFTMIKISKRTYC